MLTSTSTPTEPAPEPPPLVIESPAALALYELWCGFSSVELVVDDHYDRLEAATAIAAHVVTRASRDVYLVLCDINADGIRVFDRLSDHLSDHQIYFRFGQVEGGAKPPSWSGISHDEAAAYISDREGHLGIGDDVCIVVAGRHGLTDCIAGRTVTVTDSEGPPRARYQHASLSWGVVPLDIVLAGAPETRC